MGFGYLYVAHFSSWQPRNLVDTKLLGMRVVQWLAATPFGYLYVALQQLAAEKPRRVDAGESRH
jgi:hypothetical protein